MQSSTSDTEEMLAGDPAEGTSQPLLKVSLQGDNLEDQSLAMEPGWEQEHVFLPLYRAEGATKQPYGAAAELASTFWFLTVRTSIKDRVRHRSVFFFST